jgi:iron-sulfur cluster assembly protein
MNITVPLPDGLLQANEKLVCLTPEAAHKIEKLIEREKEGKYLRIKITGGGCNGLSYKMKFVPDFKSGDLFVFSQGASILVDSRTALYLRGTTLDYSDKLVGGGFKFANPNAKASCSCGESFNL